LLVCFILLIPSIAATISGHRLILTCFFSRKQVFPAERVQRNAESNKARVQEKTLPGYGGIPQIPTFFEFPGEAEYLITNQEKVKEK